MIWWYTLLSVTVHSNPTEEIILEPWVPDLTRSIMKASCCMRKDFQDYYKLSRFMTKVDVWSIRFVLVKTRLCCLSIHISPKTTSIHCRLNENSTHIRMHFANFNEYGFFFWYVCFYYFCVSNLVCRFNGWFKLFLRSGLNRYTIC